MTIALCLFGLFRSFEQTYQFILKNLDLENKDYHLFITTSNYNNKKIRFSVKSSEFLDTNLIKTKINSFFGKKLKILEIMNDKKKKFNREDRMINLLENFIKYKKENNINYDKVIIHRLDVIFVSWKKADNFYEERKVAEKREKGLLFKKEFNFPIGVKNHGCCCIQKCPNNVDVILKYENLNTNEIYCYEDYWIGHNFVDFLICNYILIEKMLLFWKKYKNKQYLHRKSNNKNLNSLQSYDNINVDWWNYSYAGQKKIKSHNLFFQFKLFLLNEKIKTKSFRFIQDCSVLYIR
tara:strand:+ start:471 stop:1352 length:882 start_codon:yes stop_codon:yes gene_type:complete